MINHIFTLNVQMVDLGMSSILIKFPSKAFRNMADAGLYLFPSPSMGEVKVRVTQR